VLFYLFFEAASSDVSHHWRVGGRRRVYASFKFFLYTLAGSLLMLLAIMAMYGVRDNRHRDLAADAFPVVHAKMVVACVLCLARRQDADVPVHTWLPDAHVEARPRVPSSLLHPPQNGRLRVHPLLAADVPEASLFHALVFALSIIAIIYTSLVALCRRT